MQATLSFSRTANVTVWVLSRLWLTLPLDLAHSISYNVHSTAKSGTKACQKPNGVFEITPFELLSSNLILQPTSMHCPKNWPVFYYVRYVHNFGALC